MTEFSHFNEHGEAHMVDVGAKPVSHRRAIACGRVRMRESTVTAIKDSQIKKGDVLQVARLAGIMAAKKTGELIPLCHPLALDSVQVEFDCGPESIAITATASLHGKTGVEMEALTAVATAALTIYDMCKSIDREMQICEIHLQEKSGGSSGHFRRPSDDHRAETGPLKGS